MCCAMVVAWHIPHESILSFLCLLGRVPSVWEVIIIGQWSHHGDLDLSAGGEKLSDSGYIMNVSGSKV